MSDERNRKPSPEKQRIRLPDGTWGVYMGETGGAPRKRQTKTTGTSTQSADAAERRGIVSRYSLNADERRAAEDRKRVIRERRAAANAQIHERLPQREPEEKKFYHKILDRIHMWHLGISVNIESIIKAVVIGLMILVFAMLQVTVFSKLRPFGATPDLMLPLVIAIGITEGERWGGVSALAAAFLIDCLGSAGITLLPLLYVPCAFIAGVLGTYYLRDSLTIRVIFSVAAGILRAVFTIIYVYITFASPDAGLMFRSIIIPEFISTLVFSILPHLVSWLAMKPFHKTRAERVD